MKSQVLGVYVDSLKLTWEVGLTFGFLCFIMALLVQEISLRDEPKTEFGILKPSTAYSSQQGVLHPFNQGTDSSAVYDMELMPAQEDVT